MSFLDTHALLGLADADAAFRPYAKDAVTGHANLLEFHFHLTRTHDERTATALLSRFWRLGVAATEEDVRDASRLRTREKRRGLSFIDALGCAMAVNRRLGFVTGDGGFAGLPGVEGPKHGTQGRTRRRG